MELLFCDTETFSETPISHGTHAYAEKAEIMLFGYAFNDGPVEVLDFTNGEELPQRVLDAFFSKEVLVIWHNAPFDLAVLRYSLGIRPDLLSTHCTMAQALAHSLPGGLGLLCDIMGVVEDKAKIKEGKELIQLFCKPRPKNHKLRRATRETHPEKWEKFIDYAGQDIEAMRELFQKLPTWNYSGFEKELWALDQKINNRGFLVDTELAEKAVKTIDKEQRVLSKRTQGLTFDDVEKATQRDKLLQHITKYYKVELPDMQKSTLRRRVEDPTLPAELRELLTVRLESSTSSTSKYKALLRSVSWDGRLRGTLQFCGASRTGRWAGRVFQPQNLPRPTHSLDEIENGIRAIKSDSLDLVEDSIMKMASSCVRGCAIAPPMRKLVISDLANIEGRAAAWLAGEEWKIDAYTQGEDLYVQAYARAFRIPPDAVTDKQRQIGKVMELMLQYAGGVGAFLTGVVNYGIDLDELAEIAWSNIPDRIKEEAEEFYEWQTEQGRGVFDLEKKTFLVCDSLKRLWREAHPEITSYWNELRDDVRLAIQHPNNLIQCRKIQVIRKGGWLRLILPSARSLCYPSPRVDENGDINYMGINQYTRKWARIRTYGGKFFENICQALARDVMAWNMPTIETEGYNIVLSVHDEIITETPDSDNYTAEELSLLLANNPEWAEGLPLAAGGFETHRYRKG